MLHRQAQLEQGLPLIQAHHEHRMVIALIAVPCIFGSVLVRIEHVEGFFHSFRPMVIVSAAFHIDVGQFPGPIGQHLQMLCRQDLLGFQMQLSLSQIHTELPYHYKPSLRGMKILVNGLAHESIGHFRYLLCRNRHVFVLLARQDALVLGPDLIDHVHLFGHRQQLQIPYHLDLAVDKVMEEGTVQLSLGQEGRRRHGRFRLVVPSGDLPDRLLRQCDLPVILFLFMTKVMHECHEGGVSIPSIGLRGATVNVCILFFVPSFPTAIISSEAQIH
mmetsp:Transcript_34446/g.73368  ORF Transcript_34446/g.73368 Transcript_34446/m.73368 type:complete len:274 (-) Transcript_34446:543-1364(-)